MSRKSERLLQIRNEIQIQVNDNLNNYCLFFSYSRNEHLYSSRFPAISYDSVRILKRRSRPNFMWRIYVRIPSFPR